MSVVEILAGLRRSLHKLLLLAGASRPGSPMEADLLADAAVIRGAIEVIQGAVTGIELRTALRHLAEAADAYAADQDGAHPQCGRIQPITAADGERLNAALKEAWKLVEAE